MTYSQRVTPGKKGPRRPALVLLAGLWALLSGCVDEFRPDVISPPTSYLVVDGLINLRGVTTVRLSRTRPLDAQTAPLETKATVAIQDESGTRYPLTEQAPGTYVSAALTLPAGRRYQLRLRTAAGHEYASDPVTGKLVPPIDQLSWAWENHGAQLYVDAHDDTDATRYYRWTYQETWEFNAPYHAQFEYVNGAIRPRQEDIYKCWRTENSTAITLGNTTRLSRDVVSKFPLLLLPADSWKLRTRYSILVQQYAMSAEEYTYLENLKKNTELLGTLFDPLPSQQTGNVHGLTDPAETVIGYVGASNMEQKRLFISRSELPATARFNTGYEKLCEKPDTVYLNNLESAFGRGTLLPLYEVMKFNTQILDGYGSSITLCADCRLRGTNVKPSFW